MRVAVHVDRIGRLIVFTVALAFVTWLTTRIAATNVRGFDWVGPVRILRSAIVRPGFPTWIAIAWLLGKLVVLDGGLHSRIAAFRAHLPTLARDAWVWHGLVFGVAAAAIAHIVVPGYHVVDLAGVALLIGARCVRPATSEARRAAVFDSARAAVLFIAAGYVFTVVKAFLFVAASPKDAAILAFESALFGRPIHHVVAAWAVPQQRLMVLFDDVYLMIFEHMTVASVFLVSAKLPRERAKLWAALTLAYLIGGPSYYLLAGLGPAFFEPELYRPLASYGLVSSVFQDALLANTNAMRAQTPIMMTPYSYIACMPSLHMGHELIMLYYARFSRPFFLLSLLFTTVTAIAVLALGWHYFVDIFGGVGLAAVAVLIVRRFGAGIPVADPGPSATEKPHAPPDWARAALLLGPLVLLWPAWRAPLSFEDLGHVLRAQLSVTLGALYSTFVDLGTSAPFPLEGAAFYRPGTGVLDWVFVLVLGNGAGAHHLASLALAGVCAWLFHRLLIRLEVEQTTRWVSVAIAALHPVGVFAAGYVSSRSWLVIVIALLAAANALIEETRRARAVAVVIGAAAAMALLHEGAALLGLALPFFATRRTRVAATMGALGTCASVFVLRTSLTHASLQAWPRQVFESTLGGISHVVRAAGDAQPSPGLVVDSAIAPAAPSIAVGVFLVVACVLALHRSGSAPARGLAGGAAIMTASALAIGQIGAVRHGASSAAALPTVFALSLVGGVVASRVTLLLRSRVSPALRKVSRLLPVVVTLALLPVGWASLSSMGDAAVYAETIEKAHPMDDRVALLTASVLLERGEVGEASAICGAIDRDRVTAEDLAFCTAVSRAQLGAPEEAVALLRPLMPRFEASPELRSIWVLALVHSGDGDTAIAEIERLRDRYPDDAQLRRFKGDLRDPASVFDVPPPPEAENFAPSPTR